MKVEVVTPEEHLGDIIGDLNSRRGQISGTETRGPSTVIDSGNNAGRVGTSHRVFTETSADAPAILFSQRS